jgi:prepilin-type N-terminal cleavage/methylation domain-containing protein
MIKRDQKGFTLVEMIMAMAIFSFMLLIILIGFLNIVHLHQAGISARDAQQNARFATEDMVRTMRESSAAQINGAQDLLCLTVGGTAVQYRRDAAGRIYRGTGTTCAGPFSESALTSSSTYVVAVKYDLQGGVANNPSIVTIHLSVALSSTYTYTGTVGDMHCGLAQAAAQYCSVANINTAGSTRNTL